jgi:hypothetical protein
MMRFSLAFSTFLLFLGTSSVFAQTAVGASRSVACTINSGYTIADVVETARSFPWSEESAPGLVVIRNRVAGNGSSQFDFIIDSFYPSYTDMIEKRGALLQRRAGRNGRRGLAGVATCNDNVRIRNIRFAAAVPGGPGSIQPLTAVVTTGCDLNGATVADVVALASGIAETVGAGAFVRNAGFGGGQGVPINARARMTFFFPSFADFGAGVDRFNQNQVASNQEDPISCGVPSLWASYRIHSRSN